MSNSAKRTGITRSTNIASGATFYAARACSSRAGRLQKLPCAGAAGACRCRQHPLQRCGSGPRPGSNRAGWTFTRRQRLFTSLRCPPTRCAQAAASLFATVRTSRDVVRHPTTRNNAECSTQALTLAISAAQGWYGAAMNHQTTSRRRPRTLALELVESLGDRISSGQLAPGTQLPTESGLMVEFGVSRTVVREAISRLQAAGLVATRHGVGSFVVGAGNASVFRIEPQQLATLRDVVAVLELRIGVETEAAGLAAQRRSDTNLTAMRAALDSFAQALDAGQDAVAADFQFHSEIARATQNGHFANLLATLGSMIIPRARLDPGGAADAARQTYLRKVNAEHESIFDAITNGDTEAARAAMRTHLANSRERRRKLALLGTTDQTRA